MEYAVIIGIVITALAIMQVYMKRGIQAATKAAADELSLQSITERIDLKKGGYLIGSNAHTETDGSRLFYFGVGGDTLKDTEIHTQEDTNVTSNAVYNQDL